MNRLSLIYGLVSVLGCLPNELVAQNTFLGAKAGFANQTGTQNTFVGYNAGMKSTATANTFISYQAGASNTSGTFNSFIGVQAGVNNTTGSANYFFGTNAGASNISGTGNYFLGDNAGGNNTNGSFNVYIGANAGNGPGVNGDNNLALGFEAGKTNQSGVNNTFIGFRADAGAGSLSNATAIGNNAKVSISNAVVLGSAANIGIGTSAPTARLHVASGVSGQSGLRLEQLTSGSGASLTNQTKFLTVDASGNVILGSVTGNGRQAAMTGLWRQEGETLFNANAGVVVIGEGVSKLPGDYSLIVSKGILTEKVKVAVRNTDEWSDKVFSPKYALKDLPAVEKYIQQYKHLPGIPSAEEMVERGNDLHQTDAKLLEKIEELTLHSIKLNKTNQLQSDEIQTLKQQRQQDQQALQTLRQKQAELEKMVKQLLERK